MAGLSRLSSSWNAAGRAILISIAMLVVLLSLAGAIPSNEWWLRVWDFPRLIVFAAGALALAGLSFTRFRLRWAVIVLLLAALAYQAGHIYPYTMLAPTEAERIEVGAAERRDHCFSVFSLNVLQKNRDYGRTLAAIEAADPDILLLMETDRTWAEAMAPVLTRYPHRLTAPLANTYGLVFATRLPMLGGEVVNLTEPATPSAQAVLTSRSGRPFRLAALHPRPPHPGQDTDERDAEIAIAAMITREAGLPALTIGDFNDVGWSETSQLFRRLGRYVDPRIGRGFYATFPAWLPGFRWPLDHIFFTEDFTLLSLSTGGSVGSDHLPVEA
ncbi:MAG: endonuclease/exonuclease/phosphatase family protein, partial [Sphingomonadales bacterium]|nr:endonuclease/exonuclease/phosphatase family protein [Sphingomonadales bacterium]